MTEAVTVDSNKTIVDEKLFKIIGLYYVLSPTQDGRSEHKYRKILIVVSLLMLAIFITQIGALYFALNDFQRLAHMIMVLSFCLITCFKGYVLVRNANRMWPVLELGRYSFTSSGHRDPSKLIQCRAVVFTMVRLFAMFNYCVLAVWLVSPFFIHEPITIIHLDGTVSKHPTVILNVWVPLSEAKYNSPPYWTVIYGIEVLITIFNVIVWTMFDCYMMTVCFVLDAQFRTVATAYQTTGQHHLRDDSTLPTTYHFNRLICHIKDNQKIVR